MSTLCTFFANFVLLHSFLRVGQGQCFSIYLPKFFLRSFENLAPEHWGSNAVEITSCVCTLATVLMSHGRMVRRSISSQDTCSLSWAISTTSRSTCICVPQPTSVTSLPVYPQVTSHVVHSQTTEHIKVLCWASGKNFWTFFKFSPATIFREKIATSSWMLHRTCPRRPYLVPHPPELTVIKVFLCAIAECFARLSVRPPHCGIVSKWRKLG